MVSQRTDKQKLHREEQVGWTQEKERDAYNVWPKGESWKAGVKEELREIAAR